VEDGIVSLRGTVDRYKDKLKAEKDARHNDHVTGVRDLIQVGGVNVPDAELQSRLAKKLAYDRIGFGHVFNALTLQVKNGVVAVGGAVINPADRDSALSIVQNQPGVKDVIDRIQVLPTSPFDDDIRMRTLRAIYGDPVLSRYAMDPQAPIRIVVDRGHVTLVGAVDNQMDKQIAGMRANQVFGAFTVDNELVARNQVQR
jgi:osmotically-inducible protein OsmY